MEERDTYLLCFNKVILNYKIKQFRLEHAAKEKYLLKEKVKNLDNQINQLKEQINLSPENKNKLMRKIDFIVNYTPVYLKCKIPKMADDFVISNIK